MSNSCVVPLSLTLQLSQVQKFLLRSQKSCRWPDPFTLILEIITSKVRKIGMYLLCLWKLLKGKVYPPEKKKKSSHRRKTKAHLGSQINNLPYVLFCLQYIAWNKENITALPYSYSPSQLVTSFI